MHLPAPGITSKKAPPHRNAYLLNFTTKSAPFSSFFSSLKRQMLSGTDQTRNTENITTGDYHSQIIPICQPAVTNHGAQMIMPFK